MIILIPLGGLGTRFKNLGYKLPKPLINVMGKPIICWLLDNLNLDSIDYVIIPYNPEIEKYRFEFVLKKQYPNINFIFIKLINNTRGAAETIYITLEKMKMDDMPILCLDGDNFYIQDIVKKWNGDNCIYVFKDSSDTEAYSYIQLNENKIIDIVEKQKISDLASTGGYGFNSWHKLRDYCKKIIDNNIMQKNEFYTSTVIREMLKDDNLTQALSLPKIGKT
jgi:dTDP-glucose pyrophosphorylase